MKQGSGVNESSRGESKNNYGTRHEYERNDDESSSSSEVCNVFYFHILLSKSIELKSSLVKLILVKINRVIYSLLAIICFLSEN